MEVDFPMDEEIRLVRKALAGNEDALLGFKRILGELERVASVLYWTMHCAVPVAGGRCNARIDSRSCSDGHAVNSSRPLVST